MNSKFIKLLKDNLDKKAKKIIVEDYVFKFYKPKGDNRTETKHYRCQEKGLWLKYRKMHETHKTKNKWTEDLSISVEELNYLVSMLYHREQFVQIIESGKTDAWILMADCGNTIHDDLIETKDIEGYLHKFTIAWTFFCFDLVRFELKVNDRKLANFAMQLSKDGKYYYIIVVDEENIVPYDETNKRSTTELGGEICLWATNFLRSTLYRSVHDDENVELTTELEFLYSEALRALDLRLKKKIKSDEMMEILKNAMPKN